MKWWKRMWCLHKWKENPYKPHWICEKCGKELYQLEIPLDGE